MGRIVKAVEHAGREAMSLPRGLVDRESLLAEATRVLVAARAAAKAELVAAREAAPVLARKMAEKIIGRAVELDTAVMGDIAAKAVAAAQVRPGAIVLRVHPDDRAAIEQTRPRWMASLLAADVNIVADEAVGRYGCIVDTAAGRVDARLETQLSALELALRASLLKT
jgi:flagellar biosynthesis/type III secretory pathway protein FliH